MKRIIPRGSGFLRRNLASRKPPTNTVLGCKVREPSGLGRFGRRKLPT